MTSYLGEERGGWGNMKKDEFITRRGKAAWGHHLEQSKAWKHAHIERVKIKNRAWYQAHAEQQNASAKKWQENHPEKVAARNHEVHRKGGKYYEQELEYERTGVQGERNIIRMGHRRAYRPYKKVIAPESQIHHQWIPQSAAYTGLALVEAGHHQHGIIDVIQILEGEITLLTEEAIKNAG